MYYLQRADSGEGESRGSQGVEAGTAGAVRHPDHLEAERADGGQGRDGARAGRQVRALRAGAMSACGAFFSSVVGFAFGGALTPPQRLLRCRLLVQEYIPCGRGGSPVSQGAMIGTSVVFFVVFFLEAWDLPGWVMYSRRSWGCCQLLLLLSFARKRSVLWYIRRRSGFRGAGSVKNSPPRRALFALLHPSER